MKAAAASLGLPVTHRVDDVLAVGADLGVVVAFGQLIKPHVLGRLPMVNLHFSLLPRWRGAAPVERALLAGDAETGVGLMQLEEGLDTGPVYAVGRGADRARRHGRRAARPSWSRSAPRCSSPALGGLGDPVPQEGEPTYAAKLDPAELRLDWTARRWSSTGWCGSAGRGRPSGASG